MEQLIQAAQAGDREALQDLLGRFQERLASAVAVLTARVPRRVEPEEVVQETLFQAVQSIGRFRWQGGDSFFLWLCGMARNVLRKRSGKASREQSAEVPEDLPDGRPSPSKLLRRNERFDRLEAALAGLKPEYRIVLRLSRIEGLKVKDIAARLGRTEHSVRHLLARATLQLKAAFGDTETLHLPDRLFPEGESRDEERE